MRLLTTYRKGLEFGRKIKTNDNITRIENKEVCGLPNIKTLVKSFCYVGCNYYWYAEKGLAKEINIYWKSVEGSPLLIIVLGRGVDRGYRTKLT